MTKINGTLQNGTATAVIPRGTFTNGSYTILAHYFENDSYREGISTGNLTINPFSFLSLNDYSWAQWTAISNPTLVNPTISDDESIVIEEENRWVTTKEADMADKTFTRSYPYTVTGTGTSPEVQSDGSLRVYSKYCTDWMYYENDEDWDITLEIKIKTFNSSQLGIATATGTNGGIWNIHGKWFDYNDVTSAGSVRTYLTDINYGNGSVLNVTIQKRGTTVTWHFTDTSGDTQEIICNNFEQTSDTRFYIICPSDETNLVVRKYNRLTHIVRKSSVVTDVVKMGRHNCVVLERTIPVNLDNFVLNVTLKTTKSNDAIFLGKYRVATGTQAGQYNVPSSSAFIIRQKNITSVPTDFAVWNFVFQNGICKLFINNVDTGLSYDFTSYTDDFRLMFVSYATNSLQLSNITWSVNT